MTSRMSPISFFPNLFFVMIHHESGPRWVRAACESPWWVRREDSMQVELKRGILLGEGKGVRKKKGERGREEKVRGKRKSRKSPVCPFRRGGGSEVGRACLLKVFADAFRLGPPADQDTAWARSAR